MSTQHTPGPYTLDTCGEPLIINAPDGKIIALVYDGVRGSNGYDCAQHYDGEQALANARLIAAAPQLRAVLADLFTHCAMVHNRWGEGSNQCEADAAIARGRALLEELK